MEMVFQYMWKHRMLGSRLQTTDGRTIEVLSPGRHNSDAGPDFAGARLRIGGDEWAGNVEVHVKASDWYRHHHDTDHAYDNVILHVVGVSDMEITDPRGRTIPQTIITFPTSFITLYSRLAEKISDLPCREGIHLLPPLTITDWLTSLSVERMQQKAQRILQTNKALDHDWEWTCYATLARALGFGLNSDPLEMTARITPLRILQKHSDNQDQIEALLLGQAGLLDSSCNIFDERYQWLCREYYYLARKYGLKPARRDMWKYSKTRPQNFPERRIALLAQMLAGGFSLLSEICSPKFSSERFDELMPDTLSFTNRTLLLINFAAPLKYAYGAAHQDPDMGEQAMELWESLAPENNKYIRLWQAQGITCRCAADSQAVIQLCREYCDRSRCLECRFGHTLLRNALHN